MPRVLEFLFKLFLILCTGLSALTTLTCLVFYSEGLTYLFWGTNAVVVIGFAYYFWKYELGVKI